MIVTGNPKMLSSDDAERVIIPNIKSRYETRRKRIIIFGSSMKTCNDRFHSLTFFIKDIMCCYRWLLSVNFA